MNMPVDYYMERNGGTLSEIHYKVNQNPSDWTACNRVLERGELFGLIHEKQSGTAAATAEYRLNWRMCTR